MGLLTSIGTGYRLKRQRIGVGYGKSLTEVRMKIESDYNTRYISMKCGFQTIDGEALLPGTD